MANYGEAMKLSRINKDAYYMRIAETVALRGECGRRQVGAVIVDQVGRILSTGMNGLAPGKVPCIDSPCAGAQCASGEGLDLCEASHAEISALVYLPDPKVAHTIYCTTEPCVSCTKAISLTGIQRVVYRDSYPLSGAKLWVKDWVKYEETI